jgi:hypothetical protein
MKIKSVKTLARSSVSIARLRQHVEDLAAAHEIFLVIQSGRQAHAIREADGNDCNEVHTPPVRSAIASATALHEIGHILGRYGSSRRRVVREQHLRSEVDSKQRHLLHQNTPRRRIVEFMGKPGRHRAELDELLAFLRVILQIRFVHTWFNSPP